MKHATPPGKNLHGTAGHRRALVMLTLKHSTAGKNLHTIAGRWLAVAILALLCILVPAMLAYLAVILAGMISSLVPGAEAAELPPGPPFSPPPIERPYTPPRPIIKPPRTPPVINPPLPITPSPAPAIKQGPELAESHDLLIKRIPVYRTPPDFIAYPIVNVLLGTAGPYTACASINFRVSDDKPVQIHYALWQVDFNESGTEQPLMPHGVLAVHGRGPHIIDTCGIGIAGEWFTRVELRAVAYRPRRVGRRPAIRINPHQPPFMRAIVAPGG